MAHCTRKLEVTIQIVVLHLIGIKILTRHHGLQTVGFLEQLGLQSWLATPYI